MIFKFAKATALISELSRSALAGLFTMRNKSCKVVTADQHCQGNPAGGMFGQLVSRDTTHRQ